MKTGRKLEWDSMLACTYTERVSGGASIVV